MTESEISELVEPAYRQKLRDYLARECRPQYKYGHQPRLYALTQQIGAGMRYDDDVVFAAVWLHDLGVFVGHRPEEPAALKAWDHVAYITKKAPGILQDAGFPAEKVAAVLEVIRTHQPQDAPATLEGQIARDADILELLGAIGILRTVSKVDSDTRFHTFTDARLALQKQLATLPERLTLASAKKLAEPRVAILQAFLDAMDAEAGPNLY